MSTLEDFNHLRNDLFEHLDVLIQLSENYYVLCRETAERERIDGGRAFNLIRRAVGHEIVSRLYRLIETSSDARHFQRLMEMLEDNSTLQLLMPRFNHDGLKSFEDLIGLRNGIVEQFAGIRASDYFHKVDIYRNRFVAHRVPNPHNLKKYTPTADVTELSSAELRWLTDSLSAIAERVNYMFDRSGFPAEQIARIAQNEAHALWGLERLKDPDFLERPFGRGR